MLLRRSVESAGRDETFTANAVHTPQDWTMLPLPPRRLNSMLASHMTIIAFHYTEETILAVSDGLISRGNSRIIEENVKIIHFTPRYKIPRVSLGRLSGFDEYIGGPFCLAYAGNYTLIASAVSEITAVMSRRLVLDRDSGKPTIYRRTDEGKGLRDNSYWDNFNFSRDELPDLSMNLVSNIVSAIVEKACQDFVRNAMTQPDIELLVFGQEIIKHNRNNRAQFISCKRTNAGKAELDRYSILPWRPFCFGEKKSSEALLQKLEGSNLFNNSHLVSNQQQAAGNWMAQSNVVSTNEKNRNLAIKDAVLKLIATGTDSIGGSCTIAEATWSRELQVTTINHEAVVAAISV